MSDLISRQSLIHNLQMFAPEHYSALVNNLIMGEPSAEHKGEWVRDYCCVRCSECGAYAPCYDDRTDWLSNYCPNCGARLVSE